MIINLKWDNPNQKVKLIDGIVCYCNKMSIPVIVFIDNGIIKIGRDIEIKLSNSVLSSIYWHSFDNSTLKPEILKELRKQIHIISDTSKQYIEAFEKYDIAYNKFANTDDVLGYICFLISDFGNLDKKKEQEVVRCKTLDDAIKYCPQYESTNNGIIIITFDDDKLIPFFAGMLLSNGYMYSKHMRELSSDAVNADSIIVFFNNGLFEFAKGSKR